MHENSIVHIIKLKLHYQLLEKHITEIQDSLEQVFHKMHNSYLLTGWPLFFKFSFSPTYNAFPCLQFV